MRKGLNMLVYDIETAPRPDAELQLVCDPFNPATVEIPTGDYPAFDPSAVKLGNLKDQSKVAEKIEAARQLHEAGRAEFEAAKANGPAIIAAAEQAHWGAIRNRAALSPVTGQVLAIGCYSVEGDKIGIAGVDSPDDEKKALAGFWRQFLTCKQANRSMVGFNSSSFDLPFMVKRSWLLGVDVPTTLQSPDGRYFDRVFVDLLARWKCGVYGGGNGDGVSIKLANMAKFFGVGDKPDGVTGADFARLWREERERAREYLVNDLKMTAACAQKMGIA